MARPSRRKAAVKVDNRNDNEDELVLEAVVNNHVDAATTTTTETAANATATAVLPAAVRERNRAVAEREASRLARPERRVVGTLGHANKSKSAVTSTPSGVYASSFATINSNSNTAAAAAAAMATDDSENNMMMEKESPGAHEEWCGPFSVARQVSTVP